jgi:hypothetical protein
MRWTSKTGVGSDTLDSNNRIRSFEEIAFRVDVSYVLTQAWGKKGVCAPRKLHTALPAQEIKYSPYSHDVAEFKVSVPIGTT